VYTNLDYPGLKSRVVKFKNDYFPVESGLSDHILRNTPFGFVPGHHPGKLEYANPKPVIDKGEFYDRLNETEWGYGAPLSSRAIDLPGYQALIDDQFNIEEHPRLDITRQTPSKGRYRRSQYAYLSNDSDQ
jgi:hypothetical protein